VTALQIGMTASPSAGGLDRYFEGLLRALPLQGVAVRSVVGGEGGTLPRRWARVRARVSRALPASDLIVSHFAPYAFAVLDRLRARPHVVHFHGPWAAESAMEGAGRLHVAAKRGLERLVYQRGARLIVLSRAFAEIAQRDYGVAPEAIRIVPGGLDCARYVSDLTRVEARAALDLPADRPLVVSVRRLVRAKGLEQLIDAVTALRARVPDVLVALAGRGRLADELARRVRERGLERHVRLLGFVADARLPDLYRAADLAVVPTLALEGFGLTVVEALACGTPVVVTPVAGLPEVVAGLDPALVLAGSTPPDLARGIASALDGTVRLPSSDACARYARRFDWSVTAARVADVYREVA
jgi:glycosyltransferase involved in cell wall biosynthesis